MILEKVEIKDFMSISEATIHLTSRGLVAIKGINLDPAGADSNGSGKSTLINAILWCNYDDAGKKLDSVDDVIRRNAKGGCRVACTWYDEQADVRYVIERFRKHPTFKNIVTVRTAGIDLTKGKNDLTQALINEILGCDKKTFEAYCFSRQNDAPDIPGMTDGELKSLLEKVLPFDDLSVYHKDATANLNKQISLISELKSQEWLMNDRVSRGKSEIEHTTRQFDGWDAKVAEDIEKQRLYIDGTKNRIFSLSSQMKPEEKLKAALEKFTKLVSEYDNTAYITAHNQVAHAKLELNKAEAALQKQYSECPTCGQALENYEALVWNMEKVKGQAVTALRLAQEKKAGMEASHAEFEENVAKLEKVREMIRHNERLSGQIATLQSEVERSEGWVAEEHPNPHKASLERLMDELKRHTEKSALISAQILSEQAKLPILEATVATFSPKGVRYHILEQVTPALNERTNYYLSQLCDGKMKAVWSTVMKLKSGEYRERFSIEVTGEDFAGYGSLSGGEQRKVRLACFFALQDVISKRATKSINIWCGDEIDHALDVAGLERLMNVLHEKTATKSTILVISHNDLSAWIPNTVTVTKNKGVSQITGFLSE